MKKQIAIAAFTIGAIVLGTNTIQAQKGANSNPASTAVNIKLKDVISIDSGVAIGGVVDFNYETAKDYYTAKNVEVKNSLVITSSRGFDVKVKAEGKFFVKDGTNSIPVDVMQVTAVSGGTMDGDFKAITLSDEDQVLVSGATKGPKKSLTIDYSISADNASEVLLGTEAGKYTQNVTYTATAL